jgi:hypothetical protein
MTIDTIGAAVAHAGIHLRDDDPQEDGSFRAVTLFDKAPNGVLVWAGYECQGRNAESRDGLHPGFVVTERVSFMFWDDVWAYFREREYARLIAKVRPGIDGVLGV